MRGRNPSQERVGALGHRLATASLKRESGPGPATWTAGTCPPSAPNLDSSTWALHPQTGPLCFRAESEMAAHSGARGWGQDEALPPLTGGGAEEEEQLCLGKSQQPGVQLQLQAAEAATPLPFPRNFTPEGKAVGCCFPICLLGAPRTKFEP